MHAPCENLIYSKTKHALVHLWFYTDNKNVYYYKNTIIIGWLHKRDYNVEFCKINVSLQLTKTITADLISFHMVPNRIGARLASFKGTNKKTINCCSCRLEQINIEKCNYMYIIHAHENVKVVMRKRRQSDNF